MNADEFYTAAFLNALPACLTHYYHYSTEEETGEENRALLLCAVNEAHSCAALAREKWLVEKENARRRGGAPE
jgi:hypothetical protein